ncbi:MAG: NAD(P)/FAD-dependent oxidoreductase [Ketobacter sp.]|uniref:NAD(P)/FAD-dependent oxidoreductase n=1 Tax=unclassified Ketobacter TaxID=2639109 RepID=UPI0025BFD1AF|nr:MULTISPECIES: FAD-dependent oxidoreductase [unclassified Ketobacter]MEC8812039.1 FAD-dependent oxidoreductase [Pseudomonadota bacterium]
MSTTPTAFNTQGSKPKLVFVGNGMAGTRTLEELLAIHSEKYEISVIGEENFGNYNRIMLSPVLAGEKTIDNIMLNDEAWYRQNNITFYKGERAIRIDRNKRRVMTTGNREIPYDRLVLATGSVPVRIPVPGHDLKNVLTFRHINDVNTMLELSGRKQHAAVIGGGLLGLEAANGLRKQGMKVTVVHAFDSLLNRQLDKTAARLLQQSLEEKGIEFVMGAMTAAIEGNEQGEVERLQFKDGTHLDVDMVVMATGVKPNIELAKNSGLQCDRGILVNDVLQTFDPAIYAVGECIQHRGQLFGLVAPTYEQARVCANHLAEMGIARYIQTAQATQLKITGIHAFSAGVFDNAEGGEEITFFDQAMGHYKKLVIKDNTLVGAVLYGDTQDGGWFFELIQQQTDISAIRDQLIFGKDFCTGAQQDPEHLPEAA